VNIEVEDELKSKYHLLNLHAQISVCENKLYAAIRDNDIAALDNLLHEKLLFHLPDGRIITKSTDLETYASGNVKVTSISASELQISEIAGTAVVSVRIALTGTYIDPSMDGEFRYLRIWQQHGGNWQIIAGSCTAL
jgi:ketosteroid isomerase-like protein